MLKQSINEVKVEGILSEINLKTDEYEKNGIKKEYIRGDIKIKLSQVINDKMVDMELPIYVFSTKYTNKGTINPSYTSIAKVMNDYISIASCGNEEDADRIRLTSGIIRSNEFCNPEGRLIIYPRIEGSFFTKVRKDEYAPNASFSTTMVIVNIKDELTKEGEETGRLVISGGIIQYGEKIDVVDYVVSSKSAISHMKANWEVGDTVFINGLINYSSTVTYVEEEMDFGDPVIKPITSSVRDFIISKGSNKGMTDDNSYDKEEIQKALVERKMRLDALESEYKNKKNGTSGSTNRVSDFGF